MKRLAILSLSAIFAILLVACGTQGATPDASGNLSIFQEDSEEGMNFEPDSVVLAAGQKVRITLENHGSKDHEFMVGRNVVYTDAGAPNGFEVDFFEGIEDIVQVDVGQGAMLMIDGETVKMGGMEMSEGEMGGEMEMEEEAGHEEGDAHVEGHMGWMVMNAAESERTIIEFTVPEDRVGEWEMACFEDDGAHYDDGMRGKLVVVEP